MSIEVLSFGIYLVNSEFGTYIALDHSQVYGYYPTIFQFNPAANSDFKTIYLDSCFGFVFVCSLLLNILEFSHQLSPTCKPCLSIFNSEWKECYPIQIKGTQLFELVHNKLAFCSYGFLFLSLALHIKCQILQQQICKYFHSRHPGIP